MNDEYYMDLAIKEAKKAFSKDEIPVGAVIVYRGKVLARAYNRKNKTNRVKDHAEILVIDKVNKLLKNWRLDECDIYITLEPCPMCASAIEQARIRRVITGAVNNNFESSSISSKILINKKWTKCVQEERCTKLLNEFFKMKR